MSDVKLPVVLKDDVLDLRNNVFAEFDFSKNSVPKTRKSERQSLKSVSQTALDVKQKILGDYDEKKMEQNQINTLKSFGKNQNIPGQRMMDDKKYKFRSKAHDPRFRRSRSPTKKLTNSQSISAIKPTPIKMHHRARSVQALLTTTPNIPTDQLNNENETANAITESTALMERGTMTDNLETNISIRGNPPLKKTATENGSGEKLMSDDYYWNDTQNLDKRVKPPLVKAKSSVSSFTKKSLQKLQTTTESYQICPRCRHHIKKECNDASTYVFDDVSDVTDIQPIFSQVAEKISSFTKTIEKSKLKISKFLIGYLTALVIVTLTIAVLILLDPTPILEYIENYFYEQPLEPEIVNSDEASFMDIFNFFSESLFPGMKYLLDGIVDKLTARRKQNFQVQKIIENKNGNWWPF